MTNWSKIFSIKLLPTGSLMRGLIIGFGLFVSLLWVGCANVQPLVGGEKDVKPPGLDTAGSTLSGQVNSFPKSFELSFDEWVQLKNAQQQIVVSPPLQYTPTMMLRGKKVKVTFDERDTLRPNTTYTIQFGTGISDLTESNVPQDLSFLFSTGPMLDSLEVVALVNDAFSNTPIEAGILMLYEDFTEEKLKKGRPLFFGKIKEPGAVSIKNLPPGQFTAVALEDLNNNYRLDPGERVQLYDSLLTLAPGLPIKIKMQLSAPDFPLKRTDLITDGYGQVVVAFNRAAPQAQLRVRDEAATLVLHTIYGDSIKYYYTTAKDTSFQLILEEEGVVIDTFAIKATGRQAFLDNRKGLLLTAVKSSKEAQNMSKFGKSGAKDQISLPPLTDLVLAFDRSVSTFDATKFQIVVDSTGKVLSGLKVEQDSILGSHLLLKAAWPEIEQMQLLVLPGAATDMYGKTTTDTMRYEITLPSKKLFGDIALKIDGLDSSKPYVVQLVLNNQVSYKKVLAAGQSRFETTVSSLGQGTYYLQIISDDNANGRWDGTDFAFKAKPELVYYKKLEPLRPNWSLEVQTSLDMMKEPGPKPVANRTKGNKN
jgi:uncharacterized protein (DUF2141 family)